MIFSISFKNLIIQKVVYMYHHIKYDVIRFKSLIYGIILHCNMQRTQSKLKFITIWNDKSD